MSVDVRDGGCWWRKIGPFSLAFSHDDGTGTPADEYGITSYRFP